MDEVAIWQQLEWDGNKYCGYINMGNKTDDRSLLMAKEALVFLVVAVNDNFKLPVGYFLINGLGALARSNSVKQSLSKLSDVRVDVTSSIFDGAESNIAMANHLDCNLNAIDDVGFTTSFLHRVSNESIGIFSVLCHVLNWLIKNP